VKTDHIIQGDAIEQLAALPAQCAQAIIADPPYFNVLEDEAWDTQWAKAEDYLKWSEDWVREALRIVRPDGLCFVFGQPGKREHTFIHLMSRLCRIGQYHDLIIWDRVVGYNERRDSFTPQYEMLLVLRPGAGPTKFNKDAVRIPYDAATIKAYLSDKRYKDREAREAHLQAGKFATNLLRVPSLKGTTKEKVGHPSQKPLALIHKLIQCCTDPGDLVVDPFFGSGTTGVAADGLGRRWIGIEKDPAYVKMAQTRLGASTQGTLL
jgi:DNA modification methylase